MIVALGNEDKLYDASLAHILELFRQAHPEIQLFELPVHGKRPNQRIKDNLDFLLDYLQTDILVYQLPFPLFCNFAIDIFKHVILRLIFLHITYSYSFHCILRHMFY